MLQEIRRLIELAWGRLASMLQAASPGSLQLTGVLGLAALLVGYYQLRGRGGSTPPPSSSSRGHDSSSRPRNLHSGLSSQAPSTPDSPQQQPPNQQPPPLRHQQHQPQPQHLTKRGPLPAASPPTAGAAPRPPAAHSALAAAVRSQLQGMKRVTLSAPGVLLEQWDCSDLGDAAAARDEAVAVAREIARASDLFLVAHVPDDVGAALVAGALEAAGLLGNAAGQVPPQRLLLCGTTDGKVSIVRQLEPDLHVDASARTVGDLSRFVPQLLLISEPGRPGGGPPAVAAAANVEAAASLAEFFSP